MSVHMKIPIFREADDDVMKKFVTLATVAMVNDTALAERLSSKVSSRKHLLVVKMFTTWRTSLLVPKKFKKLFTLRLFLASFNLSQKGTM